MWDHNSLWFKFFISLIMHLEFFYLKYILAIVLYQSGKDFLLLSWTGKCPSYGNLTI